MNFIFEQYRRIIHWIQNLNRIEKSAILTLLSLFFVVLFLAIIQLRNTTQEDFIEIISEKDEFVDVEKVKKLKEQEKWEDFLKNARATTQSYNESDKKLRHKEEPFKRLDEIRQEKEMKESSEKLLVQKGNFNLSGEIIENLQKSTDKVVAELNKENTVNKNSFVRYSLKGRKPLFTLPNPIYLCDASGKIVIDIIVNSEGRIVKLKYNSSISTSSNECLVESALSYARQARFNRSLEIENQSGSITYYFQGR